MSKPAILRFSRYSLVGGGTFAFDLLLLFLFSQIFDMNVTFAAGLAFAIAVSINYMISRHFVFHGSERGAVEGYANFLLIAFGGLALVSGMMYVFVTVMGMNYLISRISVALLTGFWNYSLNLYLNFKVAGKSI